MKIVHQLSINTFHDKGKFKKFMDGLSISPQKILPMNDGNQIITYLVYENQSNWLKIQKKVKEIKVNDFSGIKYDKEDYDNAKWLQITVSESAYPQPENDYGYKDVSFNLKSYCDSCGMGLIQDRPIRLSSAISAHQTGFLGLHWLPDVILVRKDAKQFIEDNNISNVDFGLLLKIRLKNLLKTYINYV